MGKSQIEWTDFTFNPWIGCKKVSEGCKFCYAESLNNRMGWTTWGETYHRTSKGNWQKVRQWNKENPSARVFCASLADVLDLDVPEKWREDLYDLIRLTPNLIWLMLTKRPENYKHFIQPLPDNVWFGVTVESNDVIERLRIVEEAKEKGYIKSVFVSAEPLLGPLPKIVPYLEEGLVNWVIAGGESGYAKRNIREMRPWWANELKHDCYDHNVPFFMKQMGSVYMRQQGKTGKGAGLLDMPVKLRVRRLPDSFPQVED